MSLRLSFWVVFLLLAAPVSEPFAFLGFAVCICSFFGDAHLA